ncbi:MAG TPA: DUF3179 domain-containing protein [Acidimicrobiales bacterium]|nr:DUF3179 domain-containing protein [Acidimicrobiales bacterium]
MLRLRILAPLAALGLVAAACGSGDDDTEVSAPTPADGTDVTVDPSADGLTDLAATADDTPLFSPTETDEPFDLDGGVTSGNADTDVIDDPDGRGALAGDVAQASEPWPTDWTRRTVDVSEIALGIGRVDPRDAIPPIDVPTFETPAQAATWLRPAEPGALVQVDGEARFYPLSILTRHEIVNDRFGDVPVAVTFCPLCNTALSFDRRVDGEVLRFGVSGLLRLSDLVMWDDATTTLWQQITGEGIVGELAGTQLAPVSTAIVSFEQFATSFPEGRSLSRETGFGISYGANPYVGYSSGDGPIGGFFAPEVDPRFPALERVVGVSAGGEETAYPFSVLESELVVNDTVGGEPVVVWWGGGTVDALDAGRIADSQAIGTAIAFDPRVGDRSLTFEAADDGRFRDTETGTEWNLLGQAVAGELAGEALATVTHRNEFWFAWAGFFPDARVFEGS